MAQVAVVPPQPVPPASTEDNPLEASASTSSSSYAPGDGGYSPSGSRTAAIIENSFLSSEST